MSRVHHAWGCTCPAPACAKANQAQRGFDRFLGFVLGGLYLAGFYVVIRAGIFAWMGVK